MTAPPTAQPERLYLMELMRTTAALPGAGVFEWIMPCYLVQTTDGKNILIDTGLPAGDTMPFLPPPEHERDVIAQLRDLGLRPEDISTVIATRDNGSTRDRSDHNCLSGAALCGDRDRGQGEWPMEDQCGRCGVGHRQQSRPRRHATQRCLLCAEADTVRLAKDPFPKGGYMRRTL